MKALVCILLLASLAVSSACGDDPAHATRESDVPAIEVWAVAVTQESISESVIGTGSIAPHKTSNSERISNFT